MAMSDWWPIGDWLSIINLIYLSEQTQKLGLSITWLALQGYNANFLTLIRKSDIVSQSVTNQSPIGYVRLVTDWWLIVSNKLNIFIRTNSNAQIKYNLTCFTRL